MTNCRIEPRRANLTLYIPFGILAFMTAPSNGAREELLDRALDLFAAYGYDGVGVQQICAAAGVTKPTLYHHFGSKRGLLEALMEARLEALSVALAADIPCDDLEAALAASAEATFAFAAAERTFYRLYLTLWFAPIRSEAYEVAQVFHARHFERVERFFLEAGRSDATLHHRERSLAAAFLGALNNHIGLALNNYAALNGKLARDVVQAFLYGALSRGADRRGRRPASLPIST